MRIGFVKDKWLLKHSSQITCSITDSSSSSSMSIKSFCFDFFFLYVVTFIHKVFLFYLADI